MLAGHQMRMAMDEKYVLAVEVTPERGVIFSIVSPNPGAQFLGANCSSLLSDQSPAGLAERARAALLPWLPEWAEWEGGEQQQGRKGMGTQQMLLSFNSIASVFLN